MRTAALVMAVAAVAGCGPKPFENTGEYPCSAEVLGFALRPEEHDRWGERVVVHDGVAWIARRYDGETAPAHELAAVDVSDPTAPVVVGQFDLGVAAGGALAADGDRLLLVGGAIGAAETQVATVDISDPASPSVVATALGPYLPAAAADRGHGWVVRSPEGLIDVDLATGTEVGVYGASARHVWAGDDLLAWTDGTTGSVVDFADPGPVATVELAGFGVAVTGGSDAVSFASTTGESPNDVTVEVVDPVGQRLGGPIVLRGGPVTKAEEATAAADGDRVYVQTGLDAGSGTPPASIQVLDVSDRTAPSLVAGWSNEAFVLAGVAASGGVAFALGLDAETDREALVALDFGACE